MRDKLPLIYLAGPYSVNPRKMYVLHAHHCADLLNKGHMVYSPIVHCHPLVDLFGVSPTYDWRAHNFNTLIRCDELHVIDTTDLASSVGTQNEISIAKENNIPITYIVPLIR